MQKYIQWLFKHLEGRENVRLLDGTAAVGQEQGIP